MIVLLSPPRGLLVHSLARWTSREKENNHLSFIVIIGCMHGINVYRAKKKVVKGWLASCNKSNPVRVVRDNGSSLIITRSLSG